MGGAPQQVAAEKPLLIHPRFAGDGKQAMFAGKAALFTINPDAASFDIGDLECDDLAYGHAVMVEKRDHKRIAKTITSLEGGL